MSEILTPEQIVNVRDNAALLNWAEVQKLCDSHEQFRAELQWVTQERDGEREAVRRLRAAILKSEVELSVAVERAESAEALARQYREALEKYVEWHGAAHEPDCPADDTCECAAAPVNAAVNAALALSRPPREPAPSGEQET